MDAVTVLACELLKESARCSSDGNLDEREVEDLVRLIGQLKGKENEFADVYHRAKLEVIRDHARVLNISGGAEELIGIDLIEEDAYCYAVTSFCRMVRDNVEQLLAHNDGTKRLEVAQIPHYDTIMGVLNTKPLGSDRLCEEFA